jgi:adenylate cyclase class 2
MVENEIKLPVRDTPEAARLRIEALGYRLHRDRTLESDQLFDDLNGELKNTDRILRLRRVGDRAILTYKGPAQRTRHKSREEIETDISDPAALVLVLDRLGYQPGFRYEKYRTMFRRADETGVVTLDETPIGLFLELEGPTEWVDRTAAQLGYSPADYLTVSYAFLYREYRQQHLEVGGNMTFDPHVPLRPGPKGT